MTRPKTEQQRKCVACGREHSFMNKIKNHERWYRAHLSEEGWLCHTCYMRLVWAKRNKLKK